MPLNPLAELVYRAHKDGSTGCMIARSGVSEAQLLFHRGDLVGVQLAFGHQSAAQALLSTGRIGAGQLDALWARGEAGRLDPEVLEDLGQSPAETSAAQLLASVRSVARLSEAVRFEPCAVEATGDRVGGPRLVRAAIDAAAMRDGEARFYRCADVGACEAWLESAAEREFLEGFAEFRSPEGAAPEQLGLLRLLALEQLVDNLSESEWREQDPKEPWRVVKLGAGLDEARQVPLQRDNAAPSNETENWVTSQAVEDDLAQDPSDPAEAARLRRLRLIHRGMDNLGGFGRRPDPPGTAQPVEPAEPVAAAVAPAEAQPIAGAEPDRSAEGGSASVPLLRGEEAQLARQIEQRYDDVQAKKDHFVLLGVGRDASTGQVKAAFLGLAKVFHPDRLPPSLAHLAAKATAVFEAARDAHDALHDDKKRADYLQALTSGSNSAEGAKAQKAAEATEAFRKGELFFKKREYRSAEEHFQRAFGLDPRGAYLASAAWAIYMDPARKDEAAKAKQLMVDALGLDRKCDRAHYQLGLIARVEGDIERAERHFCDAVGANPKHLEANQELRLIRMRKKKDEKKGGLFR